MAALLAVGIGLAAALPITTAEAYAFVHFVRPAVRDQLALFDPANHVLNTLLMKRAVGLLRLSAFSLRVPELVGLALYLWAVARLVRGSARRFATSAPSGWPGIREADPLTRPPGESAASAPHTGRSSRWSPGPSAAIAFFGAAYFLLDYATPAAAVGLGLGLALCAVERMVAYLQSGQPDALRNLNLAGMFLGLTVAAHFCFLLPAAALALAVAAAPRRFPQGIERVLVTATVTAFILLALPLGTVGARDLARLLLPPQPSLARTPEDLSGLVAALRRETRGRTVRIAAQPEFAAVLEFYQARFREGGWRIEELPGAGDLATLRNQAADYYVIEARLLALRGRSLYRGRRVVLTR